MVMWDSLRVPPRSSRTSPLLSLDEPMSNPAVLKLLPSDAPNTTGPRRGSTPVPLRGRGDLVIPTAKEMAHWRCEADAHMEDALVRFDAAIVAGEEPGRAAHRLCHHFMGWTRISLRRFGRVPMTAEQRRSWSKEHAVWTGLADLAAVDAPRDPACIDRFLVIWLGVVHEAAATGRAWLFSE